MTSDVSGSILRIGVFLSYTRMEKIFLARKRSIHLKSGATSLAVLVAVFIQHLYLKNIQEIRCKCYCCYVKMYLYVKISAEVTLLASDKTMSLLSCIA